MDLLRRTIPLTTPALKEGRARDCDARHLRGHLRQPSRSIRRSRRGAACVRTCARGSTRTPRRAREDESGFPVLLDGRAGAHAGAQAAGRAGQAARAGHRRRVERAGEGRRSRGHAAHAARQLDHRRRGSPRPRRSPTRSRTISAPTCCSIARRSPMAWSRCQRRHWDPVLAWARDALGARFVLVEGVMHVAQPREAIAAARARISGERCARALAAWRAQRRHHDHRLGAAGARARRTAACRRTRPGPRRMSTRTGTCSSGAATSWRCSAAPTAARNSTRRRWFSPHYRFQTSRLLRLPLPAWGEVGPRSGPGEGEGLIEQVRDTPSPQPS